MSDRCKFVRKNCKGWEYGYIEVESHATSKEKRNHVVLGHADTMDEALQVNVMALKGSDKIRPNIEPRFWD